MSFDVGHVLELSIVDLEATQAYEDDEEMEAAAPGDVEVLSNVNSRPQH